VYNGIDIENFPMRSLDGDPSAPLQLMYAGGLLEHKGVHTAIEAMGILAHRLGVRNAHLTLVGDGHPAYVEHLKRVAEDLNVSSYVTFFGRVPRFEMPHLMRRFDVLLFPSTGPEPLPRVVQEAMACGLVVIGTDTGGTPEILHDGENGLVFEAGDANVLADQIARIGNDRRLHAHMARAARRTVLERFTLDRMVDEIESYFAHVIAQSEQADE